MPALLAVIGANADPMRKELAAVQRMVNQTSRSFDSMGSGGHGGQSGIIHETMVLIRELSRGNFTRVPGSLSILLQRMGVLNLLIKDSATASRVLADAWEAQASTASLAALAATRKASASLAAFEADEANTASTLEQAVADEEGAAAAIMNAKATQAKAIAAREAAAAQAEGASVGIGAGGIAAGVLLGLIAGAYAAYKESVFLKNQLTTGFGAKDFNPDYFANKDKASNRSEEDQKNINKEIEKTIELYNSAAKAASRVAETTKNHFEHLRKMNSYERDPAVKTARELEINQQERKAQLANKIDEQTNLGIEADVKQRQAQDINVSSRKHDEELLRLRKEAAEAAEKFLNTPQGFGHSVGRAYNALALTGVSTAEFDKAGEDKKKEAHEAIAAYKETVNLAAANEELRKKREELIKQAESSAAKAAGIGAEIPDITKANAQAAADEAEESAAAAQKNSKFIHGKVTSLQQIGAYASEAVQISEMKRQSHLLEKIVSNTGKVGGGNGSNFTGPHF